MEKYGYAGPFSLTDTQVVDDLRRLYEDRGHDFLWSKRNQHVSCAAVATAGQHEEIVKRVESILGPNVLLWTGHLLPRRPGPSGTDMHRDGLVVKMNGVHISLAVTEMTAETGCMRLIPGSHRWGRVKEKIYSTIKSISFLRSLMGAILFKKIELQPGQFFLTRGSVLHFVGQNTSDHTRLALVLRYCSTETPARNPQPAAALAQHNRKHSPLVDDNDSEMCPCLLVQGVDQHGLNDVRPFPQ